MANGFTQKVWIAAAVTALFVIVILLVKSTFSVFLMILAGSLIALFFHGLSDLIQRKLKAGHKASIAISVLGTLGFLSILFFFIGTKVQSQVSELSSSYPSMVQKARSELSNSFLGQKLLQQADGLDGKKLMDTGKKLFSSTFGVLGDLYVILFLGIFLTASPGTYKKGIIALIPSAYKNEGARILYELAHNLKSWLKGKIFSMVVVSILTATGLSIINVPLVFTLSLIAGILNFIPNFGPIIAMVPAVLIGLSQGTNTALMVAGLYIFIQVLESNIITPFIQKKLVNIPPALIIAGQLIIGPLTGYLGIILATPVLLIVITLIKELYIKNQNQT